MSTLKKIGLGFVAVFFGIPMIAAISREGGGSSRVAQGSLQNAPSAAAERAAPSKPVMDVSAMKLWQDYEANEVAADNIYKGNQLRVSGVVSSIDKDAFNNMVIGLKSPNEFMPTRAQMSDADAANVARLSKGMQVSLNCECSGRIIGSPSLRDCTFSR